MSRDDPSTDTAASTDEPRTKRARTEAMTVALRRAGGIYSVRGESGNTYRVDISRMACTCPDHEKPDIQWCKHLRRVDLEIRNRTVPTPDGRLPERPVADGGVGAETGDASTSDEGSRIEGPIREFDTHDRPTGLTYFRCRACGRESMRRRDLGECCPVSGTSS